MQVLSWCEVEWNLVHVQEGWSDGQRLRVCASALIAPVRPHIDNTYTDAHTRRQESHCGISIAARHIPAYNGRTATKCHVTHV